MFRMNQKMILNYKRRQVAVFRFGRRKFMENVTYEELIGLIQNLNENEEIIIDSHGVRKEDVKHEEQ